jgi:hypothetical protein
MAIVKSQIQLTALVALTIIAFAIRPVMGAEEARGIRLSASDLKMSLTVGAQRHRPLGVLCLS